MIQSADLEAWHPLRRAAGHLGFRDYLREVAVLVAEARAWAAQLDEEGRDLVRNPAIHADLLAALPPPPFWMQRIARQRPPRCFANGAVFFDWPFSWLTDSYYLRFRLAGQEDVDRWEGLLARWLALSPVHDWIAPEDPAAEHYPAVLADAPALTGSAPSARWRKWARGVEPSPALLAQITAWVEALGRHADIAPVRTFWPQLASYFVLLVEYETTLRKPAEGISAAQRALIAEAAPNDPWAASRPDPPFPPAPPEPDTPLGARVLRQFAYFARLPWVEPDGSVRTGRFPSDPRLLSPENEARAAALVWLLREAFPEAVARPLLRRIAEDLSLRLHSFAGVRERSFRAARAAVAALHELGASEDLAALAAMVEGPKLRKACAPAQP